MIASQTRLRLHELLGSGRVSLLYRTNALLPLRPGETPREKFDYVGSIFAMLLVGASNLAPAWYCRRGVASAAPSLP